ncbi:MAG: beta-ketoacyl synthase [Oceanospirillaceae bacterium]|nr:beta-ketoacyl synthase [Oceanospirillaceae bacterium]MBT13262.1 beta-ketoacyl synthase [Oceanospirillaceae bacterium]|tara:strand:- start:14233 stop:15951 length:1719 start_codon:yes stop_codon:yes gene_type:complete
MRKLAVITAFGGINAAGRSSGHQAFRRLVLDQLSAAEQNNTLTSLAQLMGLDATQGNDAIKQQILDGTLVREWDNLPWDARKVPFHEPFKDADGHPCWRETTKPLAVQSAGQTPKGFDPAAQYNSRHHPRGLSLAVYAASDMLGQLGMDWDTLREHLHPDQIAVYAGSAMGQLDGNGHGGMIQARMQGKRTSSKQCAMGLSEMPADFINAYVLGNVGATGSMVGACATFLYNLKVAIDDIQSGRRRLVIVGNSESPLTPEIVEGYSAMTALITEKKLRELDGRTEQEAADFRRASRPFSYNAGFTLAESGQFFVLTDDELATELGLTIHGAIGDVFVHADGYKKSISNPGVGNYITMGKAMGQARRLIGEHALQNGSFVQAHGSSTPQNRVTESHILSELATAFGIRQWPVTAVKAHLGHSIAAASADQLLMTLGTWAHGIIPGITTATEVADDVHQQGLDILLNHQPVNADALPLAFINAKGFGGNNASGFIISPQQTHKLLASKYSGQEWKAYLTRNEYIRQAALDYDAKASAGETSVRYVFGEGVMDAEDLDIRDTRIRIKGWEHDIKL